MRWTRAGCGLLLLLMVAEKSKVGSCLGFERMTDDVLLLDGLWSVMD